MNKKNYNEASILTYYLIRLRIYKDEITSSRFIYHYLVRVEFAPLAINTK